MFLPQCLWSEFFFGTFMLLGTRRGRWIPWAWELRTKLLAVCIVKLWTISLSPLKNLFLFKGNEESGGGSS